MADKNSKPSANNDPKAPGAFANLSDRDKQDINTLIANLRAADERNNELTDLIARLNRNLRQLEEQNQALATQIRSAQNAK